MGTELTTAKDISFDISVLSAEEKTDLSKHIDRLISQYKGNRQAVNRLVFESVAAITAGEESQRQLAAKKGLKRLVGNLTGSNKALQDKINENYSVAQYASQQILHRLAEQNEMSFDLIAAVNNKLNASLVAMGEEFSAVYDYMERILKSTRSDMVQLENRVEKLEQNVNLLNWVGAIEYQQFDGVEYEELSAPELLVCFARDFCDITKGNWRTSDLLLLKKAMAQTSVLPKGTCNYFEFIKTVNSNEKLKEKLLGGKTIGTQPDVSYLTMFGTMKKMDLLETDEHYIVDTVKNIVGASMEEMEIEENITRNYLLQEGQVNIDCEVSNFDLLMELIYSIRQAEEEGILSKEGDADSIYSIEEYAIETEGKTAEELLKLAYQYASGDDRDMAKAWAYYKAADEKDRHSGIWKKSEQIFTNPNTLKQLLDFWAKQSDPLAQCNLGLCYVHGKGASKDESTAVEWYRKAAEQGYARAQNNLGVCYEYGTGVKMDKAVAAEWYRRAAEQGYAGAQCNLGVCYGNGIGVEKDEATAVEWYRKAAEQGYARAQLNLGVCYNNGTGVGMDKSAAVEWYRKAAEQGNELAQCNLGICYNNGIGVGMDKSAAVEWYRKAADQGNAAAQFNLGVCYEDGTGVGMDKSAAVEWYRKAADQGNATAQCNLGLCYENGTGIGMDKSAAVEWYRKAANQGFALAQRNLGNCYEFGKGIGIDTSAAVEWYRKAADQGNDYAKKGLARLGKG